MGNFSIFLLSSLLAVPIGDIAVGRALQAPCQRLQVTPRVRDAPWTGLGAIQSVERTGELGAGRRISLYLRRHWKINNCCTCSRAAQNTVLIQLAVILPHS